jgi:hypothetical protein
MSDRPGTLELIATQLTLALRPFREAIRDPARFQQFMRRLGWNPTGVPAPYASIAVNIDLADGKLTGLAAAPPLADVLALVQAMKGAFDSLQAIAVAPPGVDAGAFLAELKSRLFERILTDHLIADAPVALNLLSMFNVIGIQPIGATPGRPSFVRTTFDWSAIPKIISHPNDLPALAYGWSTPAFSAARLIDQIAELVASLDVPLLLARPDASLIAAYADLPLAQAEPIALSVEVPFFQIAIAGKTRRASFAIHALPAAAGKLPGIVLEPRIDDAFPLDLKMADWAHLRLRAGSKATPPFGFVIRPGEIAIKYPSAPGTAPPAGGIGIGVDFTSTGSTLLLGSSDGTRLEWQGASVDLNASVANGKTDLTLYAALNGLALVISGNGESLFDGFLEEILGSGESRVGIPLGLEWGGEHGIRFAGSGAFDITVHPHLTLGPIHIDDVTVRLQVMPSSPPDARVDLVTTISGSLGPLDFFIQGVGLRADATFSPGNLGPLDLDLGFVPPTGVGLSIDVGGFAGGGFLMLDAEKGEYAGGLELDFLGIVTVKAIGLLNTKFPDGHRGFSLLIIISAEFPPIQLSFGFTLLGVGGLLGLSRTVDLDALREGVHQGALDSVLFPTDIVANAPRIVDNLRRLFPPFEGHFLIGPMVKIGWGTPTIASLEMGLILEIPRPMFVILGRLRVGLPFQDLPLFDIHVAFAGGVDFEAGQLWFDATLRDSRLLTFALTGDMAVRIYWKVNANFILTVGGFHPAYTPPPLGLGNLQRLGITIFDGNPRLRAEAYFAITANTVQFGARAELFFGVDAFNVYGFIGLDVLIQFDPFHFIATLTAMLAVRSGSSTLMGIRVDALLEGPTPWHAKGTGSFEISIIISITIDVDFEITLGEARHDTLPPVDVLPQLVAAFAEPANWRAVLPSGTNLQVTLRAIEPVAGTILLHPFGSLEISEKLVPLNLPVQRRGTQSIGDGHVFGVDHVLLGDAPAPLAPLREQFAPAQFIEMSDAQKLSSPSFERYESGVQVGGGDAVRADYVKSLSVAYEVVYVPRHRKRSLFGLAQFLFDAFARGGAVSQCALSAAQTAPSPIGAAKVTVAMEQYVVVSTADLTMRDARMVFPSEAEARAAMTAAIDRDPSLTHAIQVIPMYLAKAA